ncbi:hypothetical protein [Flavobacterium sp. J27]|uniref:hypothetical protein n=1 Tax=Flavobacterium sp. J27 TaxID=2060419 RepID=UPI0013EEE48F|nr:hypothetical protein [Flavobacterium sp. J27]
MKNQRKFQISKFQIAKLSNPKVIVGGLYLDGDDNDPTTNTNNTTVRPTNSSAICKKE